MQTSVRNDMLAARMVLDANKKLDQVQQSFRMINTITNHFCPISLDERIQAHAFLGMLSYYLRWHMDKNLQGTFKTAGENKAKPWSFKEVIERLKAIRSQTIQIGGITVDRVNTILDADQHALISALGVTFAKK